MKRKVKTYDFFEHYDQFVKATKSGRRLQKNGSRISSGTIRGYSNTRRLLTEFSVKYDFPLRIVPTNKLSSRDFRSEKNYWNRFYKKFTDFLYQDKNVYDNYVGYCVKPVRSFFKYLQNEKNISIGEIYKDFYITKEEGQILTLTPEQLNFLIYDKAFEKCLTKAQREVKDIFVIGCTVALRFSDLIALKAYNLYLINQSTYLTVTSKKTKTLTQIKLPEYAITVFKKYNRKRKFLLPQYYLATFNNRLKEIGELAGWSHPVEKKRETRGIAISTENRHTGKAHRFWELMSSHTMRRTAITNMLILGMEESLVRKISGHAAGSKEFFRYVNYAQAFMDQKTDSYFEQLELRKIA